MSSSASCWLSLVQAASIALIYSKLGGCLGVTAKLGPLASTDLCAGVKGLLERLITHFGLGSSKEEDPCGVKCLLGKDPASWEALSWGSTPWGRALSHWETSLTFLEELPACLALSLAECLTAWGGIGLSAWRVLSSGEEGKLSWESSLCWWESVFFWGSLRIACLGECTACRSAVCQGSLGNACLGECTACQSAICWGSLGPACLGEHTPLPEKECYLPGKPGNCLPGRAHSLLEKKCYLLGKLGNCLPGEPCRRKSAISQGSLGTACLEEHTPCWGKSVIFQRGLGPACLGKKALGKSSFSWGRLRYFKGSVMS